MAWLHAIPEGKKQSRGAELKDSHVANLPPIDGFEYMIDWFAELGFASSYDQALGYSEIGSWAGLTGTRLGSWHSTVLREMSSAYVAQLVKSRNVSEPPPYYKDDRTVEQMRADVAAKFKALIKGKNRNG